MPRHIPGHRRFRSRKAACLVLVAGAGATLTAAPALARTFGTGTASAGYTSAALAPPTALTFTKPAPAPRPSPCAGPQPRLQCVRRPAAAAALRQPRPPSDALIRTGPTRPGHRLMDRQSEPERKPASAMSTPGYQRSNVGVVYGTADCASPSTRSVVEQGGGPAGEFP